MTISNTQKVHRLADWAYKDDIQLNGSKIKPTCLLYSNSSYYVIGDHIRYVSHFDGKFQLSEVAFNSNILGVLILCKAPRQYDSIFDGIRAGSVQLKVAKRLVNDMFSLQLLISDQQPNIIGEDYFKRLNWTLPVNYDPYIITEREVLSGGLPQKHLKGLSLLIDTLHKTRPKGDRPTLDNFIGRFSKRFEGMEVPLMQALDPEMGVGYDDLEEASTTDALNIALKTQQSDTNAGDKAAIEKSFIQYFASTFDCSKKIVELEELKLPQVKVKFPLPNAISLMATITDHLVWIDQIGGVTSNSLLGRFTLVNSEVLEHCKSIAKVEADANPGILFFDIAYMAETNVDNINRRSSIYDYQLSILNYDTSLHPLSLNDLVLKMQGNELVLFSRKLNKRMVPRIASAYNYQRSDLPVFRLLCDLQHYQVQTNLNLDIQSLVPDLPFYPRIQYRQYVLSPAKWKVTLNDITGIAEDGLLKSVKDCLQNIAVSRYFKSGIGDQILCFDQERNEDMVAFGLFLNKQGTTYVEEASYPTHPSIVNENGRPYTGQFIVSLTHNEKLYKPYLKPPVVINTQRKIIPIGRDWLYFEIYCHPQRCDEILEQKIVPYLQSHPTFIKLWFFIRYNENGHHLRLRIKLKDQQKGYSLINELSKTLDHYISSGIIADLKLNTYVRESERYGGDLIDEIEQHFCYDSGFVMQILKLRLSTNAKYKLCLETLDHIKNSGVIPISIFNEIVEKISNSFNREHALLPVDFGNINQQYRAFQDVSSPNLFAIQQKSFDQFKNSFVAILHKSDDSMRSNLLGDLMHMHVNRLFNHNQRSHEMLIYYYHCKDLKREFKTQKRIINCNTQINFTDK